MPPPDTSQGFLYAGHAIGAAAHFNRLDEMTGLNHQIPTQAASVLPPTGGLSIARSSNYSFTVDQPRPRTLFSLRRAASTAAGRSLDSRYETEAEVELESAAVLDELRIGLIRLHMLSTYEVSSVEPVVSTKGNRIEGIFLGNVEARIELDDEPLAHSGSPEQLAGFYRRMNPEQRREYAWRFRTAPDAAEIAASGGPRHGIRYTFSLVRSIRLSGPERELQDIYVDGYSIVWQGFGRIILGEVHVADHDRQITMVRLAMGSDAGGTGSIGDIRVNGVPTSGGAGAGPGDWARPGQIPDEEMFLGDPDEEMILDHPLVLGPSLRLRRPAPRYADIKMFHDDNGEAQDMLPDGAILRARKWYGLEVAVRREPTGLKPEGPDRPIREMKQESAVEILVTADSEDFEISPQFGFIRLPPQGDSTVNMYFRLRAHERRSLADEQAEIDLRFFYRFNLIEHVSVLARIGPAEVVTGQVVLRKRQVSISREYLDLDEFLPRQLNIHVSGQNDSFHLQFTLKGEAGEPVVLRAATRLTARDLEDKLERLRDILESLVLNDYNHHVEATQRQFLGALRNLAEFGRELWHSLFSDRALKGLGSALRERPIEADGLIQVSMPDSGTSFLFPWAFLYDRELPKGQHELPDPEGFWGYRYAIEQHLPEMPKGVDRPIQIDGCMPMAFMLWEDFPNAQQQRELMEDFVRQSSGRLNITSPPVTTRDDFRKLAAASNESLLYFYTHGHTRKPRSAAKTLDLLALLERQAAQLPKEAADRRMLDAVVTTLREKQSEPDKSYIELSHGRLYYYDLHELPRFAREPFVFLNMCGSAAVTPGFQENFVNLFLDMGARAVLGTECVMTVNFAHPFSKVFLGEVLREEPLARALRTARQYFLQRRNPLGLAYTLFGSGTLRFQPPRLPLERSIGEDTES